MSHHEHPSDAEMIKQYLKVFTWLFIFTALTVFAAMDWVPKSWGEIGSTVHITVGLIIAFIKAIMVIYIFMHIKFDSKFLRAFIFVPLFLFCVLTFALNVLGP
ncbi:MAG: cytochrome C oxidase subunit IV family protein [Ignavibacteriae bacterium]|nr:cytochrome C oxidase subunit IV family protein [Ignavibacteriota bacterium]